MIGLLFCHFSKLTLAMCLMWTIVQACPPTCSCPTYQVNCQNKNLTEIPANIATDVTTLQLSFNSITKITNGVLDLPALKTLSLYNNRISTIEPDTFSILENLKKLLLQHNDISELNSQTFTGLSSLTELKLYFNRITFLPSGIFDSLINLEVLNLHSNRLITFLPSGIFDSLINLEELDLHNNRLNDIPCTVLSSQTKLRELDFSKNPLGRFPLCLPSSLETLKANDVTTTLDPEHFQSLYNIGVLEISSNNFTDIPTEVLEFLPLLTQFKAEYNAIRHIKANAFRSNINLIYLDLDYNNLESIAVDAFDGLKSLQYLLLAHNNLQTVPEGNFVPLLSLKSIKLSDNPWHCDCNLRWLRHTLNSNFSATDQTSTICKTPSVTPRQIFSDDSRRGPCLSA